MSSGTLVGYLVGATAGLFDVNSYLRIEGIDSSTTTQPGVLNYSGQFLGSGGSFIKIQNGNTGLVKISGLQVLMTGAADVISINGDNTNVEIDDCYLANGSITASTAIFSDASGTQVNVNNSLLKHSIGATGASAQGIITCLDNTIINLKNSTFYGSVNYPQIVINIGSTTSTDTTKYAMIDNTIFYGFGNDSGTIPIIYDRNATSTGDYGLFLHNVNPTNCQYPASASPNAEFIIYGPGTFQRQLLRLSV